MTAPHKGIQWKFVVRSSPLDTGVSLYYMRDSNPPQYTACYKQKEDDTLMFETVEYSINEFARPLFTLDHYWAKQIYLALKEVYDA